MDMNEIQRLVRVYSDARDRLGVVTDEVREIQRCAVRERIRSIKARAARVSSTRDVLAGAIAENPHLFQKPRTQSLGDIKFGLRKSPGRLVGEEAQAIDRIEKMMPTKASELIRVKKTLDRAALMKIDARSLATIGVSLVRDDDQVVIAAASSDLDKLVEAMLTEEEEA